MTDIHDEADDMAMWTDKIGIKSASEMIRTLSARLREAEARPAVRVKPLVWEEHDGKSYRQANCVLGQYQVAWLGEFECWQLSRPKKAEQEWKEAFSRHSNKDDAKAAAQADYEARILAAVEAVDLRSVREAAKVLLAGVPNPIFDDLKPVLMGEFKQDFTSVDEDGDEIERSLSISWDVTKQIIRAALRAIAGDSHD